MNSFEENLFLLTQATAQAVFAFFFCRWLLRYKRETGEISVILLLIVISCTIISALCIHELIT